MDMPTLFLSCCVAVGFITATSLTLVNSVGQLLHSLNNGVPDYPGDKVEKQKQAIRRYPTTIVVVYSIITFLLLLASFAYLFGVGSTSLSNVSWTMVIFSSVYIAYILWKMLRFCQALFDAMRADEYNFPRRRG